MKLVKRLFALLITLALTLSIASCAVGDFNASKNDSDGGRLDGGIIGSKPSLDYGESESGDSYDSSTPEAPSDSAPGDDSSMGDDSEATEPDSDEIEPSEPGDKDKIESITRPAGLITAGAWNDNENYEYWKSLFEQGEKNGKFYNYTGDKAWGFDSYGRLTLKVTYGDSNAAVAGATVVARDSEDKDIYTAVTDANGIAYLFTSGEGGKVTVDSGEYSDTAIYEGKTDEEISIKLRGAAGKKNIIDIMFVVDVTGSMNDELWFLKNELADVINEVAANDKNAVINLALLFYRDNGDSVPFAYYDFLDVTNPENLSVQQVNLNAQNASGGGDFPEAVDEALMLAVNKQWNTGATTKLLFHVLDAPPHSTENNKTTFKAAVEAASAKGIRICPVICSGTDILTEYLMRQAAVYTAGTFIFVTDDSGIGNSHYDPQLPNVTVETLNSLLVRLINGYHSGEFAPPVYWKQEQFNNQNKQ